MEGHSWERKDGDSFLGQEQRTRGKVKMSIDLDKKEGGWRTSSQ